ncbi:MAG: VOC family protein [Ilumatobacteraceae bacterium]
MLTELFLDVPVAPWRDLGFVTAPHSDHHHTVIAGVRFVFSGTRSRGLTGWGFDSIADSVESIDGIPTSIAVAPTEKFDHGLDVTSIDHVVVMTPSLDRTCGAIETSLGLPLKRIREVGGGVRQGFHRAGSVILEVVERPDISADEPASLWGVVFVVNDLDALAGHVGAGALGPVKDAVQPGRKIATVTASAGLGVPVAFMTS